MLVESPSVFPQACICGSAKGPLVDTFISTAGQRVYICALCVKRCAKQLGLVKGERMEELLKAGELLDEATKTAAAREQVIEQQLQVNAHLRRTNEALEVLLQKERDAKLTQRHLIDTMNETSRALQESVT